MKPSMPPIRECEALDCAFNVGLQCHANAINVGGPEDVCPQCDTFLKASALGINQYVRARVGACKVTNCEFNSVYECRAEIINLVPHCDHVDCMTFLAK
jgi:Domain of Unknown Function (DUF1540)